MDNINTGMKAYQVSDVSSTAGSAGMIRKSVSPFRKGDSVSISNIPASPDKVGEKKIEPESKDVKIESVEEKPANEIGASPKLKGPTILKYLNDQSVDPAKEKQAMEKACAIKPGVSPRNARVIEKAYSILRGNRTTINEHTFTTPSKVVENDSHLDYEGKQWLWDSCFHAMILCDREPEVAKEELRAVVANQHEDGFVPHMNYFRGDAQKVPDWAKEHFEAFLQTPDGQKVPEDQRDQFVNTYWSYPDHSDITQPPVIGMAVEEVYKKTGDKEFVKEMLPKLKGYYNYLHDKRDPDGDNLISIIHPWESGWDNSQRWDDTIGLAGDKRKDIDVKKMRLFSEYKMMGWDLDRVFESDQFNVEPVDFNVLYARNMECVSKLCDAVGDKEGAKLYRERADATKEAIFDKMWDGDKYVDLCGNAEKKSGVKSAAMFYPMMLDGEKHGTKLVEKHLMNPNEFDVKYGVPTTAADNKKFDPAQYWRGNVWQNVNVFVYEGVQKLQQQKPGYMPAKIMSDKIKDSSFELLDKYGFSEYFNPEEGDGHGVQTFGWNGMVKFMEPEYC